MRSKKLALLIVLFVAAITIAAHAQTQVFVAGNISGAFGNPADQVNPLVPAITVDGPGTITVTYVSGTVTDSDGEIGPNGEDFKCGKYSIQTPIQERHAVAGGTCHHVDALIGVFVPQSRVQDKRGFNPIDGTKNLTRVGIVPSTLFFIGESKTFDVKQAGTLYLGINDMIVGDNGGGFTVNVSIQ
jgi:hypothetical protein